MSALYVGEIFESISGEVGGFPQGSRCVFIRFYGCNLKCPYCDAEKAQTREGAMLIGVSTLVAIVKKSDSNNVVLTGGEPFLQDELLLSELVKTLVYAGYQISIETNGTKRVPDEILKYATIVMDYKTIPGLKSDYTTFLDLKPNDYIKFIIDTKKDMAIAMDLAAHLRSDHAVAKFAYSPMISDEGAKDPVKFIQEMRQKSDIILQSLQNNRVGGILNIQLHKLIGVE